MNGERKTVFVVDDNVTNLTLGKNALAGHYNVFTLNSGARLLKMLEKNIPDIILLDVDMPEMDGYETITHLKANPETAHIPVIFLTAKTDGQSELKGLSMGAIDYLTKPFTPPLLLKRIEVHLLVESQKKELIAFNKNLQHMVDEKTKMVVELKNAILKTMAELVECRDDITGGHIERTQSYLGVLIEAMSKFSVYEDQIALWDIGLVLQSAQLHDVGKISIRDEVLRKPGRLTENEFEEIKAHTIFGEEVIDRIRLGSSEQAFLEHAKILVSSHHEKWDGSGYPRGLSGQDIPLLGRLMAIVDVYDALVSERPYKKAFPHEEAVAIISDGRGSHFDPTLVDLFLKVANEFKTVRDRVSRDEAGKAESSAAGQDGADINVNAKG
ncbi:MAG: response regulator [Chitinispirillia bacterium]|nr:response regulator [Chitinispirillia bacterium]MCL2241222.1 response regulator [Chitinispirillia bacterium]